MYRYWLVFCICLSMGFLYWSLPIVSYEKGKAGWYQDMPPITNWRGVKRIDWSTNVPVSLFYSDGVNNSLRQSNIEKFSKELSTGNTLVIGVDWYGLTGMSSPFIPRDMLGRIAGDLMEGNVFVFDVLLKDSSYIWNLR